MLNKAKTSVLIIEDNYSDYFLFNEYLEELEFEIDIHHLKTLEYAIDFLKNENNHVSIIFSDLNLPDSHGIEIIKELQKNTQKTTPIIFLTGLPSTSASHEIKNTQNFSLLLKENLSVTSLREILKPTILNKHKTHVNK